MAGFLLLGEFAKVLIDKLEDRGETSAPAHDCLVDCIAQQCHPNCAAIQNEADCNSQPACQFHDSGCTLNVQDQCWAGASSLCKQQCK